MRNTFLAFLAACALAAQPAVAQEDQSQGDKTQENQEMNIQEELDYCFFSQFTEPTDFSSEMRKPPVDLPEPRFVKEKSGFQKDRWEDMLRQAIVKAQSSASTAVLCKNKEDLSDGYAYGFHALAVCHSGFKATLTPELYTLHFTSLQPSCREEKISYGGYGNLTERTCTRFGTKNVGFVLPYTFISKVSADEVSAESDREGDITGSQRAWYVSLETILLGDFIFGFRNVSAYNIHFKNQEQATRFADDFLRVVYVARSIKRDPRPTSYKTTRERQLQSQIACTRKAYDQYPSTGLKIFNALAKCIQNRDEETLGVLLREGQYKDLEKERKFRGFIMTVLGFTEEHPPY